MTKIKGDPQFVFRYAKKFRICKRSIGPLLNHQSHLLTDDKSDMCCLSLAVQQYIFYSYAKHDYQ